MRKLAALGSALVVLALAGCGGSGTSSGDEGSTPTKAQVAACLQEGQARLGGDHRPDEVVAIAKDGGIIVALLFSEGSEGEEAAGELESETDAEGKQRQVEVLDGGHLVLSLSHEPSEADVALARRCAG